MIIFGVNPVREALRASRERIRYIAVARGHGGKLGRLMEEIEESGVPVRQLTPDQLNKLAGGRVHNGIVAELAEGRVVDPDAILEAGAEVVFILDGVQDPQNLGAILRVADCFGVDLVLLPEHQSAGVSGAAVKASAGASEWVAVAQVTNLARKIEELKEMGFWIYGASAEGDPLTETDFRGKVAIVLGNEGKGVRRNVLDHCDKHISIPMRGHVDSLNVSAAAAVIAYEIDRQRRK